MLLAMDVGNTNIVIGGYEDNALRFMARVATERTHEADQYAVELKGVLGLYQIKKEHIEGIMISSVVPLLTPVLVKALRHFCNVEPQVLTLKDAHNIQIDIDHPAELGMDLLACAIALHGHVPMPAVIVDLGTATKLTALDKDGNLAGVSIAPGLYLSLGALVQNTSLLSGIALESPTRAVGRNTNESMKSGLVLGAAALVDGLLERFAAELGPLQTVVGTGGAAGVVIPHCKHNIPLRPSLLLDGLYKAYQNRLELK